jgi:hypothetical protein
MFGVLNHLWSPIVPCYATEDAVEIVNRFIYNHTRNYEYNHSQLFLYAVSHLHSLTIIHVHNYNHLLHSYTG